VGDTLISLLRQLRAAYRTRPHSFPQSLLLCGVRDLQDYRIQSSGEKSAITGGSAFNIKAKSLASRDFSRAEAWSCCFPGAHRGSTGQRFTPEASASVSEADQSASPGWSTPWRTKRPGR
jgi:hypothetical protein